MRKILIILSIIVLLLLAACQQAVEETVPTPVTTEVKTVPAPTEAETEPTADETAVSPSPPPALTDTPAPTIADDIYRAGLVPSAQDSLTRLPPATTYDMNLSVDSSAGQVAGNLLIDYTNNETVALAEINFHLFPNLLGGSIDVSNVTVDGQPTAPELTEAADSVLRVPLPAPLTPGAQVRLTMDFETAVPREMERNYGVFALVDDVMALSHFYPMVMVYDDEGWHTTPPSEQGDPTFGDAAFYHATITTDDDQVVAGSGVVVRESSADGKQTIEMAAGPARDFYLAISPRYEVVSRTVGETTINSYAPAEFMDGAEAAAEFAADSLRIFSERFGPYPYTELDIVGTPTLALGIEYPGIIALTLREYDPDTPISPNLSNQVYMETTTAHEVAHQWFYNVVGNDQLQEPWLDEALAQYATYLYYVDMYGEAAANGYKESWNGRYDRVNGSPIPIGLPVSAYEGAEYSAIVYGRGPLFVEALAAEMGPETFDAFLVDYVAQNQWDIATTESFRQLAETHCQCDLGPLFETWVYE